MYRLCQMKWEWILCMKEISCSWCMQSFTLKPSIVLVSIVLIYNNVCINMNVHWNKDLTQRHSWNIQNVSLPFYTDSQNYDSYYAFIQTVLGIITLEDVIEELLQEEIEDEIDAAARQSLSHDMLQQTLQLSLARRRKSQVSCIVSRLEYLAMNLMPSH